MVGVVIPGLNGKLDGYAVRVPTADVSLVDLSVNLAKAPSVADIHHVMREASKSPSFRHFRP